MAQGCLVDGCDGKHDARGYCNKHIQQIRRCGRILKRSLKDPNEITFEHDFCRIKLYDLLGNEKGETLIDKDDYLKVKDYRWCLQTNGYVVNSLFKMGLAPFLMDVVGCDDIIIDHKDGNPLYNRRKNLRICSHQENCWNQKIRNNNTSGYKGVHWEKDIKKWRARIKVDYQGIHLGVFSDKDEAVEAYNIAALKYFGEFTKLNILKEGGKNIEPRIYR